MSLQRMQEDEMKNSRKAAKLSIEVSNQSGEATALPFKCDTCQCAFRYRQNIVRHRYVTTRPKGQVMLKLPVLSSV